MDGNALSTATSILASLILLGVCLSRREFVETFYQNTAIQTAVLTIAVTVMYIDPLLGLMMVSSLGVMYMRMHHR